MKISIPVNDKSMDSGVCPSFGRTPYFLVYETDTNESVFIENSAANSQGGAGIKAAQSLLDIGVDVLITPRCGENSADVIKAANIKMYKTKSSSINDNIDAFNDNKLTVLEEIHAGFHHHGGK